MPHTPEPKTIEGQTAKAVDPATHCSDFPTPIERIVADMLKLSDDDRMEIMGNFCRHCGCNNPRCQCWNDE